MFLPMLPPQEPVLPGSFPQGTQIVARSVDYTSADGTTLEGYVAYDATMTGKRPLVLVVHDWDGLGDYEKRRARELAEMGFVGFAVDVYGKGVRPTGQARGATAGKYRSNLPLFRERLKAGFDAGTAVMQTDASRVGAIGYCFGGGAVLEMGRAGMPVKALVPIHGSLTPNAADDKNISGRTLVLHGAIDPSVPPEQVAAFEESMKRNNKPYRIVAYPLAVHAFTVPDAGADRTKGAAYDPVADWQSFSEMRKFLRAELSR